MDLADIGGNVKDGCHIASMGGTWMVLAYGFGGLRDYGDRLSFRPQRPPEHQASIQFPITWRGQLLEVEIDPNSTTYRLREGTGLTIHQEHEEIRLTQAEPTIVRPTVQPSKKAA